MFKYAQIDDAGVCVSISFLASEVVSPHMIRLAEISNIQPGDILKDGKWTRPEPEPLPPPGPTDAERIEQLEAENADLWFDSMMKDARINAQEQEIADMWYTIMTTGGVSA